MTGNWRGDASSKRHHLYTSVSGIKQDVMETVWREAHALTIVDNLEWLQVNIMGKHAGLSVENKKYIYNNNEYGKVMGDKRKREGRRVGRLASSTESWRGS